jgi:hypothetical protein
MSTLVLISEAETIYKSFIDGLNTGGMLEETHTHLTALEGGVAE